MATDKHHNGTNSKTPLLVMLLHVMPLDVLHRMLVGLLHFHSGSRMMRASHLLLPNGLNVQCLGPSQQVALSLMSSTAFLIQGPDEHNRDSIPL